MKNSTKWIVGIVIGLVVLFALPFIWHLVFPAYSGYGYGMGMMRGYDGYYGHMPMMGYGYGFMPFGMIFMWLIPLGILALIVLGIVWLVKQLTANKTT